MPAGTPIIIDHVVYPFSPNQQQSVGPWAYGGEMYIMVGEEPVVTGNCFLRVYRKAVEAADNVVWVELDAANHPQMNDYTFGIWFDGVNQIYAIYSHAGTVSLRSFDLVSETWQAVITSFSDVVVDFALYLKRSGSDWVIYYNQIDTGTFLGQAYWRKYDGAWSTPVRVSDNISTSLDVDTTQITEDDDGLFHLSWRRTGFGSFNSYTRTLNAATGTLGTIKTMTAAYNTLTMASGVEWDDKIAVAFAWRDTSVFPQVGRIKIAYGSPTNDPTWTEETVASDAFITGIWTKIGDDGDLYVWWSTNAHIAYAHKSIGGSWSAATEWYAHFGNSFYESDGVTLTPWPSANFFHNGSIEQIEGDWEIVIGGYIDDISTVFFVPSLVTVGLMIVYCDEGQDLEVFAE